MTEIEEIKTDKFLVQTRSQTKSSGIKVSEVHSADKGLILHVNPEHRKINGTFNYTSNSTYTPHKTYASNTAYRPRTAYKHCTTCTQGQNWTRKSGIGRKPKVALPKPKPIQTPAPPIPTPAPRAVQPLPEPVVQSQERTLLQHHVPAVPPSIVHLTPACITQHIGPRTEHRTIPPYHEPFLRPPQRPPDVTKVKDARKDLLDLDMDRTIDFEENSPYQEGILSETYERPDKSYIQEPMELKDLLDPTKLVQKFLPKQTDIDKILDIMKRKVLRGTHLPLTIKEIQVTYLTSPYFKDLYFYLAQNKLPSKKSAICKVEKLAERFILLDSLLFKLVTTPQRERQCY